jgi:cytochrome c5
MKTGMLRLHTLVALALCAAAAFAQDRGAAGKDVYDVACARCHNLGEDGAPRIGDRAAWAKRAAQGIGSLTRDALEGIRNMPAHGGDGSLSDLDIRRATIYMVNQSGGRWPEPRAPGEPAGPLSGPQVVRMQCAQCHDTGFANAPRTGDHAAWLPYLRLGMDAAVRKVVQGHSEMPARGGRASLTDAEIRDAIVVMASRARR